MNIQKIVGLMGLRGAGKDTAAEFLKQRGYIRIAFADALYKEVAETFNVTVAYLGDRELKETPRPELALKNCQDSRFVAVCAALEAREAGDADFLNEPRSPRQIMQWWGTDYRRKLDDDSYWLNQVRDIIFANPHQKFVITDVRFENEAKFVEMLQGLLVRIRRPSLEAQAEADRKANGTLAHPSETELLTRSAHHEFINEEGKPGELQTAILAVF